MDKRENTIQQLLRNAFGCLQSNCNCSRRIQSFLLNDKKSLKWAKEGMLKQLAVTDTPMEEGYRDWEKEKLK